MGSLPGPGPPPFRSRAAFLRARMRPFWHRSARTGAEAHARFTPIERTSHMHTLRSLIAGMALVMVGAGSAVAHVTLENQQAPVASIYKAVFRVPHGCKGKPTNRVR